MVLSATNRALLVLKSANALLQTSGSSHKSEVLALVGRCWRILACDNNLLDQLWKPSALHLSSLEEVISADIAGAVEAGGSRSSSRNSKEVTKESGKTAKKDGEVVVEPKEVEEGKVDEAPPPEDPISVDCGDDTYAGGHVEGPAIYIRKGRAALENAMEGSRKLKNWKSLGDAAHDLAVLIGWGDSVTDGVDNVDGASQSGKIQDPDVFRTAANLCTHQSCKMHKFLLESIERAVSPTCRQMLMLKQRQSLLKLGPRSRDTLPKISAIEQYLERDSCFWRRMDCSLPAETIIQSFPQQVKALVLDLSPNMQYLYASIVSKDPKQAAVARVALSQKDRQGIRCLQRRLEVWKLSLGKALLSLGDDAGPEECLSIASNPAPNARKMDRFDADFQEIKADIEKIFSRVLTSAGMGLHLTPSRLANVQLVIVPCIEFSSWPLEALQIFSGAKSISRDFSLHMFYHRLRDQGQKQIKDASTRFISDPKGEDFGTPEVESGIAARPSIDDVVDQLQSKVKWKGLKGKEQIPSQNEWQKMLLGERMDEDCSGCFLFYGLERFLAYAGVETVAGLSISKCGAAIIVDRAANDVSYRRQSKLDNKKDAETLSLEDCLGAAAILSLSGVNIIVQNQWSNSMWANKILITKLFEALRDSKTKSIGEAVCSALQRSGSDVEDQAERLKCRVKFNTIVYGLPNVSWA